MSEIRTNPVYNASGFQTVSEIQMTRVFEILTEINFLRALQHFNASVFRTIGSVQFLVAKSFLKSKLLFVRISALSGFWVLKFQTLTVDVHNFLTIV